ncbi:hypothetical protein [Planktothrix paucivesiculata]|uniref:Superfamily II DNA and RNA helicase n=1 Tax=Planktothrix paucivesiculata PCC 9631 TaxID=671071 RepID=A0A7Z9E464_9CYAN|nr:hypothetical protein [Planktothrix paucivesiculata]VXD25397.1 conserved exported hypothetical protein [Planktothrix paucivesiculata PCC 9631]
MLKKVNGFMRKKFLILLVSLTFCWTTVACGSATTSSIPQQSTRTTSAPQNQVIEGKYPVQQAQYNDVDGEYTLMLLNTPAGKSATYRTTDLQMAQLSDEQIKAGEKSSLNITNGQPVLYLTEDFRIEYVHNVTETQTNPATGQPQTVVVRQESSFWTPFAASLAGSAIANTLFAPRYYVPPMYQSGGVMTGFGGYGSNYNQAVNDYRTRYNSPPAAVKNSTTLRTTGNIRNSNRNSSVNRPNSPNSRRSTGSGFGSTDLRTSPNKGSTQQRKPSFGSGSRSRSSSGSGSRRRR